MDVTLGSCKIQIVALFILFPLVSGLDIELRIPEGIKKIEDYIEDFGYPVETHFFKTEDDYILRYHRIPYGKNSVSKKPNKQAILLQHGLFCSSPVWVMFPEALGYVLADAGYDVWLGNSRGNTYSRNHTKLHPKRNNLEFFDYSFHEMGFYDIPAAFKYILETNDQSKQIIYVGHSMGTTIYLVFAATRPELQKSVKAAVLLAPIAHPWHLRSPFNFVIPFMKLFVNCIYPGNELLTLTGTFSLSQRVCSKPRLQFICRTMLFNIVGWNEEDLDRELLPKFLNYLPAGGTRKLLNHFNQIKIPQNGFRHYDYGPSGNLWEYQQAEAPTYNLQYAKAPIYIWYSENDWISVPKDIMFTANDLPNVKVFKVPKQKFNHLDFIWGKNAKKDCYDEIVKTLKEIPEEKR